MFNHPFHKIPTVSFLPTLFVEVTDQYVASDLTHVELDLTITRNIA